jgi:hypothetical protein
LLQLGFSHFPADRGDLRCRLRERVLAFFVPGNVEKKPRFLEIGAVFAPGVDNRLERGLFFEKRLGSFRVVPEVRLGGDLI